MNKTWSGWFWVLAHRVLGLAWACQPCWYGVEVLCFMGPRVLRSAEMPPALCDAMGPANGWFGTTALFINTIFLRALYPVTFPHRSPAYVPSSLRQPDNRQWRRSTSMRVPRCLLCLLKRGDLCPLPLGSPQLLVRASPSALGEQDAGVDRSREFCIFYIKPCN